MSRRFLTNLACSTVPLWLSPLAWWLAYQPSRALCFVGLWLLSMELMLGLIALVAVLAVLGAVVAAVVGPYRVKALLILLHSLIFLASFVVGLQCGQMVWRDRVEKLVARSQPLVAAIHEFVVDHGHPPATLEELIPGYLREIPSTGVGLRPTYQYVSGKPASRDGNPWVLSVVPPCQPMGFDSLMYFPLQNYPVAGYGGVFERVGTWGYVHE